jgi:hypothetical protein
MKKQLELFTDEELQSQGSVNIPKPQPIEDVEWCFQFFNNEPVVFAWGDENSEPSPLTLIIQPTEGQGLNFQQNGMQFTIFPRPISEESKLEREKSKENN